MPRIAAVPYINALPLTYGLEPDVEVIRTEPSRLPALLESGEAEAILVSSIYGVRQPGLRAVQGIAIASEGPAASVRVFSKQPAHKIKSLALDPASMTTNGLAQIWLAEAWGVRPQTIMPITKPLDALSEADAAVIIGDQGFVVTPDVSYIYDLGEEWTNMTGLPFIYALWTGKEGLDEPLANRLRQALNEGLGHLPELAKSAASRLNIPVQDCMYYFTKNLSYTLDIDFALPLSEFGRLLVKHGLLVEAWLPSFV